MGGGGSAGSSSPFGGSSSSSGAGFGSSSGTSFGNTGFGSGSSTGGSLFGGGTTTEGGLSNTGSGANAAVGSTSFLGAYYLNPLAQGLNITQTNIGKPLYTLTTTQGSTAAIRSTNQATSYYGAPLGIRRLPAYATILKIKDMPPPPPPMAVRADLQNMLARSAQLDSRDAVHILMDGQAVVLQGIVADADERRLVENMVLLTPGVTAIRNELAARNPAP